MEYPSLRCNSSLGSFSEEDSSLCECSTSSSSSSTTTTEDYSHFISIPFISHKSPPVLELSDVQDIITAIWETYNVHLSVKLFVAAGVSHWHAEAIYNEQSHREFGPWVWLDTHYLSVISECYCRACLLRSSSFQIGKSLKWAKINSLE